MIYVDNAIYDMKYLWDSLAVIFSSINDAWIVLEDFNYYRFSSKKKDGNPIPHNKFFDLNHMIFLTNLRDLSSISLSYF